MKLAKIPFGEKVIEKMTMGLREDYRKQIL